MANKGYRVEIPTDPSAAIELLAAVKKKHEGLGATSPLAGLQWAELAAALAVAEEQDQLSDEHHAQAEKATGARNAKMPVIKNGLRSARDVLLGLNRDNPDALGDFGFKVTDARNGKGGAKSPG